jgi:hypothetical protein
VAYQGGLKMSDEYGYDYVDGRNARRRNDPRDSHGPRYNEDAKNAFLRGWDDVDREMKRLAERKWWFYFDIGIGFPAENKGEELLKKLLSDEKDEEIDCFSSEPVTSDSYFFIRNNG